MASAVVAAAASVPAAAPALAAGLPEAAAPGCRSVAHLLAVPESGRGVDWLREALQVAVALELATIPPYLCGWWSVGDRTSHVARLIRRIIGDEMYHMGVVCNLLVAVGGRPRITDAALAYPGPLPGGVREEVNVYLSGLNRPFVRDVMMAIEAPEVPLARGANNSPGIGHFYDGLLRAFRATAPPLSAGGQLSQRIGSDVLEPVTDLDGVERAVEIIKEQGEGTASISRRRLRRRLPGPLLRLRRDLPRPATAPGGRRLAVHRRTRALPRRAPHGPGPGRWLARSSQRVGDLLDRFDTAYAKVLGTLEAAWAHGDARTLGSAVRTMRALEGPAVELMETGIPGGRGTYGPQFRPPGA